MMHNGTLAVPTQRDAESSQERREGFPSIDLCLPCRLFGSYRARGGLIDRCGSIDASVQNLADSPSVWVVDET